MSDIKKYRIISFVFAKNIKEATKKIKKAEVVDIELAEPIQQPNKDYKIGF